MRSRFLKGNFQSFAAIGTVKSVNPADGIFELQLLTGDTIPVRVSRTTWYEVLRNIEEEPQDRVEDPSDESLSVLGTKPDPEKAKRSTNHREVSAPAWWEARRKLIKYISVERMICFQGVRCELDDRQDFEARRVILMHSKRGSFGWEVNEWWPRQINALLEQWMDVLFENRRAITENDFAQYYRTNLDLLGNATSDVTQECATLSRFLYGLSSSYLLTGNPRALSAARACAAYLVNAYSDFRRGGVFCFWKFGRVRDGNSNKQIFSSKNPDDLGTYALYEQIYALSGLAQFYRVTQEVWVLTYIVRTVETFWDLFWDNEKGGFFSHLDYVTLKPDSPALDASGNRAKKNWNSVGDHIPAYLVNVLLMLDPLPDAGGCLSKLEETRKLFRKILEHCVVNILDNFRSDNECPYVQERFNADWSPDVAWGWQQDRAIVGHNLKISWNLTRCGHYFLRMADECAQKAAEEADYWRNLSRRCYEFSQTLGKLMIHHGMDLVRGGIFDAVERHPDNKMPIQFAWETTKDFWQQEQAILAYYIMHGIHNESDGESNPSFLALARVCAAFWNTFFVDQDHRKIYFRTNDCGMPVIAGAYGIQAGHAVAGYHAFELCYLAHIYVRVYVTGCVDEKESFSLTYYPSRVCQVTSINVLPDFLPPGVVQVESVRVNGSPQAEFTINDFKLDISTFPEGSIEVRFRCLAGIQGKSKGLAAPPAAKLLRVGPRDRIESESRNKEFLERMRSRRIEFGSGAIVPSAEQKEASSTPQRAP